ncbi:MAG: malto-oligosyltrehalose trehalohydrolase [Gammaproteobacteria bacterium]|nr:MAG: malto-oligosyltrehalose trehalohydrolase [Gammaproteobacteria bacterium]
MNLVTQQLPIGANIQDNGIYFRVWAPNREKVLLTLEDQPSVYLNAEGNGYFSAIIPSAKEGTLYFYQLDNDSTLYPDPASRFQPFGHQGPSQVINPYHHKWSDAQWKGIIHHQSHVIYEIHIGTFTQEGTWLSAIKELKALAELGITIIQMMPIAEFPGKFGWGYDGVNLFSPTHLYGHPDDLRQFIDQAHQLGIGVILDIVYNHIGPGNYLHVFSDRYFSRCYKTDWGKAINFDQNAENVRAFFLTNIIYWLHEFHFDGFRIDASQAIYDASGCHILSVISTTIKTHFENKSIFLIAENEPQHTKLIKPIEKNGYGLQALLNDDFHHAAHVRMTGKNETYYCDYKGTPQEFISLIKYGFLYQGQWYHWQEKRRGTPSLDFPPACFVNFLQNHDQIANSLFGKRIHEIADPGNLRAMTTLLLLSPQIPLLFQGQEFSSSSRFTFFADYTGETAKMTKEGRINFLKQFPSLHAKEINCHIPEVMHIKTFLSCKLEQRKHNETYLLHKDLIQLRHHDAIFNGSSLSYIDGAVINNDAFLLRYFGEQTERLLIINFGNDFFFHPAPEPLIAPPEKSKWVFYWSSNHPKYGGEGFTIPSSRGNWHLPGHSALIFKNEEK